MGYLTLSSNEKTKAAVREVIERGNAARRAGRLDEALACYRQALVIAPESAEANSLCGLVLLYRGRADEAEPLLRKAAADEPRHIGYRLNLVDLLERRGRRDGAIRLLKSIVADAPRFTRAWEKLGDLSAQLQRAVDAFRYFDRASALEPASPSIGMKLAMAACAAGRLNEAREALDRVAHLVPNNEGVLSLYTDVFEAQGDWRSLGRVAEAWTRLNASAARAWRALSRADWETGHLHQAMEHYSRAIGLSGRDAESLATYGRLSLNALEFAEAEAALNEAEELAPQMPHVLSGKALLLTMLGRFDEAEAYCRRCLANDPNDVTALKVLNQLQPGQFSDEELANLLRLSRQPNLHIEHRISAAFAAADCLHSHGRHNDAFAAYEAANAIGLERARTENLTYNAANRVREINSLVALFPLSWPRAERSTDPCPIFIVGMPRSGTTLVESVLAAHPRVFACGERVVMRSIMSECISALEKERSRQLNAETLDGWARAYFADLPSLTGITHITDKNPWNFDAIGLILELFPSAKIIHTRRNPIETGLSIYCNEFSKFSAFANRLEDIGHYYGQYARLMAHWRRVAGDRIITIQYEAFVANFDTAASALLADCGFAREDVVHDLLKTDRPIATFSAVQVRRGLSAGVGRAIHYTSHITPLVRALESADVDLATGALRDDAAYASESGITSFK